MDHVSRFQLAACYPAINELLSLLSWFSERVKAYIKAQICVA
jgi:hypothetical protein